MNTQLATSELRRKQQNFELLSVSQNNNNANNEQYYAETCNDPMREFKFCGSTCPVTCATRNYPRCAQDKCISGCFCRLPYVVLDTANLFGSKYVIFSININNS